MTSLQKFCQGLRLAGEGLSGLADEIEANGSLPTAESVAPVAKAEVKKEEPKAEVKKEEPKAEVKKEEPKAEVKKEEPKAEVKKEEPKAEVTEELPKDLMEQCQKLALAAVNNGRKDKVIEALKSLGAAKVTACPADKLPLLFKALNEIGG